MKNKILTISIIFILLSFIFINNNVFASVSYTYNNKEIILPDLPFDTEQHPYYILGYCNHYLDGTSSSYLVAYPKGTYDKYYFLNVSGENCVSYYGNDSGNKSGWTYYYIKYSDDYSSSSYQWTSAENTSLDYIKFGSKGYIISSTFDVYTDSSFTDFFFKAPVTEITLAQALEKIQVQEMWKTLMKNVVISLLVFVVSYLALRKAWSFLRTQLKGS